MSSCLRQSFALPKKLFICNVNSYSKPFSALSSFHDKQASNYETKNILLKEANNLKPVKCRYFSLNSENTFFETVRTSEATKLVTSILIGSHDFTGFSWTGTIIAATAVMKLLITFPCGVFQQHLVSKLELTKIELDEALKRVKPATEKRAVRGLWTQEKFESEFKKEAKQIWQTLIVKNNCHPFKIVILFLMQLPFWLLMTIAIRSLTMDNYRNPSEMENPVSTLQFQVGGPFWCRDLSQPDPTLILPTVNALSMLTIIELSLLSKPKIAQSKGNIFATKILPNFLRLTAVVFFFISSLSPASVSLFWTSSSLLSLCQNLLLMSPRMRRILRIPKTTFETDKPYSYAFNNFVKKLQTFFLHKK